jgi:hypothetical protein
MGEAGGWGGVGGGGASVRNEGYLPREGSESFCKLGVSKRLIRL